MASVKNSYLEFKNAIILSSLLSILIPVIGSVYFIYFLAEWKWVDTSIHLLVEALGSFAALSIASLILIMRRNNKIPGYYEWVSSALISMGALDILHVSLPPGDAFVWLYSMAILVGGSLFALVWLPARRFVQLRSDYTVPITVAILSIILGAFSIAVPSVLPKMLTNGDFTFTADSINVLGGALFLTAAVYFIIRYRNNGNSNDILFFNFAMLNGWAGLIFPFSELWCSCWWFFHLLRLAAYFTVITYVFSAFQLREKELIHVNETLQAEVSKRRQSEEAASELLKELKAMFDNLPLGIAYFDTEYKALNANKIHYSQIGLSEEEYIGKYCYETVGEYASDPARKGREKICSFCKFEESIKTKCPISIERRLRDSIIRMTIVPQFEKDGTVSHFMKVVEDITERKRSEEELKLSDEKYRTLIDNIQDGAFIVQDAKLQFVNEAFAGMGGYTVKEVIGKEFQQFIAPEDRDIVAERYQRRQAGENVPKEYEFHLLHKDGKTRILVNMTVGLSTYYGKVASIGTVKDITEKKKLEAQLILAQRMESIGTLAQGIAHDMNNVLSPIMLSLYMLKERFTDSESQELIEILESGAKRGADLIKQIRLFTLGIESKRVSLQVAPLISEISQIAKETFPRNIEVKTNISENLWTILGDATQLHQILMNLCVNARDAMPDGGVLSISAENTSVDQNSILMKVGRITPALNITETVNCWEYKRCGRESGGMNESEMGICPATTYMEGDGLNRGRKGGRICWALTGTFCGGQVQGTFAKKQLSCLNCDFYQKVKAEEGSLFIEAKIGSYIAISVSDTGIGIPAEKIDRIFDPFFTTKQLGKGTGLGLSITLAIVKSHGGFINVYSEVEKGTMFNVYLPAVQTTENQETDEQVELPTGHGELVLIVEDEEMICRITSSILKTHGYNVIIAHNGAEGIQLYKQHKDEVKVVIMDMMLPIMDGAKCIKTLRNINPSIKVIAVSGLDKSDSLTKENTSAQAFLPKPYTSEIILKTVDKVIREKQA